MSYQVIARKWRPQTFEEVTGQEHITRTLRNAIEHERLHHAYLFSGARGVGKTTTARLLAKSVNCHRAEGPTPTPCRTTDPDPCPSCREIAEGRSIDVLEIDAASNTGVDNVRDAIINTVGVRPARDRYKVFIIDEVHMLSGAAFNALLKTLEEPPPRVLFVMATTESHKVPATILSRCQQFEFRTIAAVKIAERLRLIADAEKIEVSDEALREVARAGEGSMRDAQSAFDQVISFSEGKIETADVEAALGIAGRELLSGVVWAVAHAKPDRMLAVVDDLVMRGHDLRNFCRDLMGHVRDLLVAKVAGESSSLADSTDAERKELAAEAKEFSESDLVRFFHSLTATEQNLRESAHPRYQLEIGLVKLVEMRRLAPLAQVIERLGALEESLRTGRPPTAVTPGASTPPNAAPAGGGSAPRRGGAAGGGATASGAATSDTPQASAQHDDAQHTPQAFSRQDGAARPSTVDEKSADKTPPSTTKALKPPAATTANGSAAAATTHNPSTTTVAGGPAAAATTAPARQTPTNAETARPSSSVETSSSSTSAPNLKLVPTPAGAHARGAAAADDVPPFPLEDEPPPVAARAPFVRDEPREPDYFADLPPGLDVAGPPVAFAPPRPSSSSSSFAPSASPSPSTSSNGGAAESDDIVGRLKQSLEARKKHLLVVALDGARCLTLGGGELCAEFAPESKHLRDTLDRAENRRVLREVCAELTGRETEVRVIFQQPGDGDAHCDEARLEQKRLREQAESNPLVRQMLKTFRAEIVEVRRTEAERP